MLERQVQRQGFLVSALVHLVVLLLMLSGRPVLDGGPTEPSAAAAVPAL